jgi:undecaprenyl-diphosphatase
MRETDRLIRRKLRSRSRKLREVDAALAKLAHPWAVLAQGVVIGAVLFPRERRAALRVAAAPAIAVAVAKALKHAIHRARPASHLFREKGLQSFPSSHTAADGALVAALVAATRRPVARAAALLLAMIDLAIVGRGRVEGGAHWPSDVAAGLAIGVAAAEIAGEATRAPRAI